MNLSDRRIVIAIIFIVVGVVFIVRLFLLQVVDDSWKILAANASERVVTEYPARGLIYDREGKILVANTAVYDLMVIPKELGVIDTAAFCSLLQIDTLDFAAKLKKAKAYSRYKPSVFEKQIPANEFVGIAENLHRFPGFFAQPRTLRAYPKAVAAHSLGYVSEVTPKILEKNSYYERGDYIGANGVESIYEEALRGQRGKRYILVDVHNNEQGPYAGGKFDTLAMSGKNLTSSIDRKLQAYGEKLMENKQGSIVAIEPATGEILCSVTNPGYDPNLLVGRVRGKNYGALSRDTLTHFLTGH